MSLVLLFYESSSEKMSIRRKQQQETSRERNARRGSLLKYGFVTTQRENSVGIGEEEGRDSVVESRMMKQIRSREGKWDIVLTMQFQR